MPRSPERSQNLVSYVKDELERYRTGEVTRISSHTELAAMFGYRANSIRTCLYRAGIGPRQTLNSRRVISHVREEVKNLQAGDVTKLSTLSQLSEQFHSTPDAISGYLHRSKMGDTRRRAKPNMLIGFVRGEIDRFNLRESSRVLTLKELSRTFGYSAKTGEQTIIYHLQHAGLIDEIRRIISLQSKELVWSPSADLAWTIGILASGGYVNLKTGSVGFSSDKQDLLDSFRSTGERLFEISSTQKHTTRKKGDKLHENDWIFFHDIGVVHTLGDLRRGEWPNTLVAKHRWILASERYLWKFIEGFFETRGEVVIDEQRGKKANHVIKLRTSSLSSANFLADLLVRVGIKKPGRVTSGQTKEGVSGTCISNLRDIKLFTENVHSKIPEKEEKLEFYRQKQPQKRGLPLVYSEQEVIAEWEMMTRFLGHSPNVREIRRLRKQGNTRFSFQVYITRFGQGSFTRAREELERIIKEGY